MLLLVLVFVKLVFGDIIFGNEVLTANYAMWGFYVEENGKPFNATVAPYPIDLCSNGDFSMLKGKIAVCLESDRMLSRGRGCTWSPRTKIAEDNGAIGVLFLAGFYETDFRAVVEDDYEELEREAGDKIGVVGGYQPNSKSYVMMVSRKDSFRLVAKLLNGTNEVSLLPIKKENLGERNKMRGAYIFTRIYTPIVFSLLFFWAVFALWSVIRGKKKNQIRWVPVLLLVDTAFVAVVRVLFYIIDPYAFQGVFPLFLNLWIYGLGNIGILSIFLVLLVLWCSVATSSGRFGYRTLRNLKIAAVLIHAFLIVGETTNDIMQTLHDTLFDTAYGAIVACITLVVNIGFLIVGAKISPYIHSSGMQTVLGKVAKSVAITAVVSLCILIVLLIEAFGGDNTFWIYSQIVYRIMETIYLSVVILLLWSPYGKSKLSDEQTTSTVGKKSRSGEVELPVVNETGLEETNKK